MLSNLVGFFDTGSHSYFVHGPVLDYIPTVIYTCILVCSVADTIATEVRIIADCILKFCVCEIYAVYSYIKIH